MYRNRHTTAKSYPLYAHAHMQTPHTPHRERERERERGHFDISSIAFITSVELVSSTWPPKMISSIIVCICTKQRTIKNLKPSPVEILHIYCWEI
jgi:hypothetical protein